MRISVIGAGCGGQAIAGYAASQGHLVNLFNRSSSRLKKLQVEMKIKLNGVYNSEGFLNMVTTNISEAIINTDLIMVITTAVGHRSVAELMAPYLVDGQTIVLNPGRTFGALEFMNTLISNGCTADVTIAEANTLIYATRSPKQGLSTIFGVKDSVAFSTLPRGRANSVKTLLNQLYPQFYAEDDILTTSLGNIGPIFHPTIALLNKDRIKNKESFDFYREGATKEIVAYMESFDAERLAIAAALGVQVPTVKEWLVDRYSLDSRKSLFDLLHTNPSYKNLKSPDTLNMRYLTEDVPTGLVPLSELGRALGILTPHIDNLIDLASEELNIDFRINGRTLDRLGLRKDAVVEDFSRLRNIKHIKDFSRDKSKDSCDVLICEPVFTCE